MGIDESELEAIFFFYWQRRKEENSYWESLMTKKVALKTQLSPQTL